MKVRKNIFTYHDGYFDLPYISNSPEIMIDSFKDTPFTKFLSDLKEIHTANIFTKGIMRYCEIEDGLWVIMTEMEFKKNVSTHALYDEEPTDYHFLSYVMYNSPVKGIGINGITLPTHSWGFYKPGTEIKAYFNKGDVGIFTNFVFNTAWLERNISMSQFGDGHDLQRFLVSNATYKTWENIVPGSDVMIGQLLDLLKRRGTEQGGLIALRLLCLQMISQFFTTLSTEKRLLPSSKLHDEDSRLVARAEKVLADSLLFGFPGITELASRLHTSSTKLQLLFKAVHGNSLFQYYQQKQMVLALQMLRATPTSLKDIALTFGYKNPSKFSAAFKKYHHILPSEA